MEQTIFHSGMGLAIPKLLLCGSGIKHMREYTSDEGNRISHCQTGELPKRKVKARMNPAIMLG